MKITIEDRNPRFADRLRERLNRAEQLRCDEHGGPVAGVSIRGRENGWFDSTWVTCCERLQKQASAILKERC